ncbi:M1 family metallopeptidase [Cellulomonas sp. S1-8]|uniref:M1 family metallopeptidase n=1 Tax=Cellulomonas sp. S1-8 TaxID=2904790 RepID=UPI0022444F83|nr:M1 family metallopeptidase [Cellulomonas sp. S1-8]UZN02128.1 M1 family metallopeptidase [Cellulomonas sp. S1-8]
MSIDRPARTRPMTDDADPYLPGRPDPGFTVQSYDLDLDYRVATNRLDAVAVVTATTTRPLDEVRLELAGLRVGDVRVDGARPARWRQQPRHLAVRLATPLPAGAAFTVRITYQGQPRPIVGRWGEVGWEELTDGVIVAGQPDGAPSWFPCHDSPGDKAAFRVAVSAEAPYTVVGNGVRTQRTASAGRVRWVYEQPEPTAPYLATVQVGRYEEILLATDPVVQRLYVPRHLRARAHADLARQPQMMTLFTAMFGPYPFAEYAVVVTADALEVPLEAQSMSTFGANHVDGRGTWERLVAHELAHQWFGNSLTVGTWRDIWLHEGFACYAEWLWSAASGGPSADVLARASHARHARLPQDLDIADPGPDRMFDDLIYQRGALVLHALRLDVGEGAFARLLRTWAVTHRHGTVDTAGFVACASAVAGRPVGPLVDRWLAPRLPPWPA